MGIFDKTIDKIAKYNTTYLTYDKLADMVKAEFIDGVDEKQLKKVQKVIKGGKEVKSVSGKYAFSCGPTTNFINLFALFAPKRDVFIEELGTKNLWQLDKSKNYKKFRNAALKHIEAKNVK